jgi:hypothetical protein
MLRKENTLLVLFIFFISLDLFSQQTLTSTPAETEKRSISRDTTKVRKHSPNAAMIMSLCLPGLGQVYNKKYWKVPLIYASMGTTLYFFNFNNKIYREYKQAYINKTDTLTSTMDLYPDHTAAQLKEIQDYHQKYRDLNVILTALFYTINVVDAYVDGHLMKFDVSDDLSLHVAPAINFHAIRRKPAAGLTLTMTF